jgi:hypothetical protein
MLAATVVPAMRPVQTTSIRAIQSGHILKFSLKAMVLTSSLKIVSVVKHQKEQ